MNDHPPLEVKVWGEGACFTRPEMKVERVSYPVPTPSAARGVLEAIFWKPEFAWRIREIWVLRPIQFLSILRNEVNSRANPSTAMKWANSGEGFFAEEDRAQRHTLALRDVAYLIRAEIFLKPHTDKDPAAYRDQFRRRVARGQCYHRPYLGCREFSADFGPLEGGGQPIDHTEELGKMLFDLTYEHDERGRGTSAVPRFFDARLDGGILRVPANLYEGGN